MTRRLSIAASAMFALVAASAAVAERRIEDATNPARNDLWWAEVESGGPAPAQQGKCTIQELVGKVRIKSLQGRGGSATYRSRWALDWTDSFVVKFEHQLSSGVPANNVQSATSGVALGFGTLDPATGWTDGVNVQARRTRTTSRLELVVRRNGGVTGTSFVHLPPGALQQVRLAWRSIGGAVSLRVMVGSSPAPVLSVDGLQARFPGRQGQGMGVAMFGSSTANFRFESSFDNFEVSGDDHDDAGDSSFDDDDGVHDDDEDGVPGNDDHANDNDDDDDDNDDDGDDDGDDGDDGDDDDDNGGGGTAGTLTASAFASASSGGPFPLLESDTELRAGVWTVERRMWNAGAGRMVRQWVIPATGEVVQTVSTVPSASELAEWQAEIARLPVLTVSLSAAVAQVEVAFPGARFEEAKLDVRLGVPWWEIEYRTATGMERETRVRAN